MHRPTTTGRKTYNVQYLFYVSFCLFTIRVELSPIRYVLYCTVSMMKIGTNLTNHCSFKHYKYNQIQSTLYDPTAPYPKLKILSLILFLCAWYADHKEL